MVTFVGGTNIESDKKAIVRPGTPPDIIIGTPGRLLGLLDEMPAFRHVCQGVRVLVMDEADRLLDMGFKRDIDKIVTILSPVTSGQPIPWTKQTLLFSATVNEDIHGICKNSLKSGYQFIDTVGEEAEQTHAHVPQYLMTVPLGQQLRAISQILEAQMTTGADYKIIVFFATARQTEFMAEVFNAAGVSVLEIHSRKSQPYRTRVADTFRKGKNLILFSSDVSARGMDYPDVTFVLQVGLTDKSQYIHRLGRTARAGKQGAGCLLVAPFEERSMRSELVEHVLLSYPVEMQLSGPATKMSLKTEGVIERIGTEGGAMRESAETAWAAWLGFYNSQTKKLGWSKQNLVDGALLFARSVGLNELPALPNRTLSKMGLKGCPGLKGEADTPRKDDGRRGGGGGAGRGSRGAMGDSTSASRTGGSSVPRRPSGPSSWTRK